MSEFQLTVSPKQMPLKQQTFIDPIGEIISLQGEFLRSKSLVDRKNLGQFFTGSIVSDYMASLVIKPKSKTVRILDAGAGTGILTASIGNRSQS